MRTLLATVGLLLSAPAPCEAAPQCADTFLHSSTAAPGDEFGRSVSVSGSFAMVGGHQLGNGGPGLLCVFEKQAGVWRQVAQLLPSDVLDGYQFGGSVSLSGTRALIGARLHSVPLTWAGAAYVYDLVDGAWVQTAKLQASDPEVNAYFGYSLSLDGDRALVGAYGKNGPANLAGAAYVFELTGSTWNEVALLDPGSSNSIHFGREVAIRGDVAVVGAYTDGPGSVWVYERGPSGWSFSQTLTEPSGVPGDDFGWAVAVGGGRIVVGERFGASPAGVDTGAVHVYEKAGAAWIRTAEVFASDANDLDRFGSNLQIAGDELLVAAPAGNGATPGSGAAYLFRWSGLAWIEVSKLFDPSGRAGDVFGNAVAIGQGEVIVTQSLDPQLGSEAGSAIAFCSPGAKKPLVASPLAVSVSTGGDHHLELDFGPAWGGAFYWILGSATGTSPGLGLGGGIVIPLVPDFYTQLTLTDPFGPAFSSFAGFLASEGKGAATLRVPAGDPSLAGIALFHAVALSVDLAHVARVGGPTSLMLVP